MSTGAFSVATRVVIWDRDSGSCVRCGVSLLSKRGSYQHRRARGSGGSRAWDTGSVQNGCLLCGDGTTGCHGYVEQHPSEALVDGYRVPQGSDPSLVPMRVHGHGWVLLRADGAYEQLDNDALASLAELAGEA